MSFSTSAVKHNRICLRAVKTVHYFFFLNFIFPFLFLQRVDIFRRLKWIRCCYTCHHKICVNQGSFKCNVTQDRFYVLQKRKVLSIDTLSTLHLLLPAYLLVNHIRFFTVNLSKRSYSLLKCKSKRVIFFAFFVLFFSGGPAFFSGYNETNEPLMISRAPCGKTINCVFNNEKSYLRMCRVGVDNRWFVL